MHRLSGLCILPLNLVSRCMLKQTHCAGQHHLWRAADASQDPLEGLWCLQASTTQLPSQLAAQRTHWGPPQASPGPAGRQRRPAVAAQTGAAFGGETLQPGRLLMQRARQQDSSRLRWTVLVTAILHCHAPLPAPCNTHLGWLASTAGLKPAEQARGGGHPLAQLLGAHLTQSVHMQGLRVSQLPRSICTVPGGHWAHRQVADVGGHADVECL